MKDEDDRQRGHFLVTPELRIGEDLVEGSRHWRIHYGNRVCQKVAFRVRGGGAYGYAE